MRKTIKGKASGLPLGLEQGSQQWLNLGMTWGLKNNTDSWIHHPPPQNSDGIASSGHLRFPKSPQVILMFSQHWEPWPQGTQDTLFPSTQGLMNNHRWL